MDLLIANPGSNREKRGCFQANRGVVNSFAIAAMEMGISEAAASGFNVEYTRSRTWVPHVAIYLDRTEYSIGTVSHTVVRASRAAGDPSSVSFRQPIRTSVT